MPLRVQSGYIIFHDSTIAGSAFRREHVEIVVPAVRFAFAFVETLLAELFAALRAEEVLHVPRLL